MLDLLLEIIHQDGTITVTRTDECAYNVEYANRLGSSVGDQTYVIDAATVSVLKGRYDQPEILRVDVWGQLHEVTIPERETGTICVPHVMVG